MADGNGSTREERLAAKLRENLRRRKAQARALGDAPEAEGESAQANSGAPLSKESPSR